MSTPTGTVSVFINYRRSDTRHVAGRLRDQIVARFGEDSVFVDVESILPGQDYVTAIDGAVSACDFLLVLIGEDWLTPDERGVRRIDDPNDRLRLEIEAGLRHETLVIPVLVDAARMPKSRELPESLVPLSRHQAVHLRHDSFAADVRFLLDAIDPLEQQQPPTQPIVAQRGRERPGRAQATDRPAAETALMRGARWVSVALLVVVLLRLLLTLSAESDLVSQSRGLSSGPAASLVWLLPAVPVVLAAILTAARGSAGTALGCVVGALCWVWSTAAFNVDQGDSAGSHVLIGLLLVGAAVSMVVAREPLRRPVAANRTGAALAATPLLVLAVVGRGASKLVESLVAGDTGSGQLLSTPGAVPAIVIPLLLAGTAVIVRLGHVQAQALLVAAWLQVLYPLVVRGLGLPAAISDGTAASKVAGSVVYLLASYCIVLAVRAGQRRALREPAEQEVLRTA